MSNPSANLSKKPLPRGSATWWFNGLAKGLVALLIVGGPLYLFQARWRIGIDATEGASCLPHTVFLIDLKDTDVSRGDFVAFRSLAMAPFYPDGTTVIKIAAGVPGDAIQVSDGRVTVNGHDWGALTHVQKGGRLWRQGRREVDYARKETVPERHWWMLATHERSYDSRYWGYITDTQVIGRAYAIW